MTACFKLLHEHVMFLNFAMIWCWVYGAKSCSLVWKKEGFVVEVIRFQMITIKFHGVLCNVFLKSLLSLLCIAFRVFTGYGSERKVEIFWNPAIFWQHVSTYFQNLVIFYLSSLQSGDFWPYFVKNIFYELHWVFLAWKMLNLHSNSKD